MKLSASRKPPTHNWRARRGGDLGRILPNVGDATLILRVRVINIRRQTNTKYIS